MCRVPLSAVLEMGGVFLGPAATAVAELSDGGGGRAAVVGEAAPEATAAADAATGTGGAGAWPGPRPSWAETLVGPAPDAIRAAAEGQGMAGAGDVVPGRRFSWKTAVPEELAQMREAVVSRRRRGGGASISGSSRWRIESGGGLLPTRRLVGKCRPPWTALLRESVEDRVAEPMGQEVKRRRLGDEEARHGQGGALRAGPASTRAEGEEGGAVADEGDGDRGRGKRQRTGSDTVDTAMGAAEEVGGEASGGGQVEPWNDPRWASTELD